MKVEELYLWRIVFILNNAIARNLATRDIEFDDPSGSGNSIGNGLKAQPNCLRSRYSVTLIAGSKFDILLR